MQQLQKTAVGNVTHVSLLLSSFLPVVMSKVHSSISINVYIT